MERRQPIVIVLDDGHLHRTCQNVDLLRPRTWLSKIAGGDAFITIMIGNFNLPFPMPRELIDTFLYHPRERLPGS